MAKKQFKAESKRLLDLMINSIYTHKEIFLRELISNASDAEDKLAYKALTDDKVGVDRSQMQITLIPDRSARTLTIRDNGVGMDEETLKHILEKKPEPKEKQRKKTSHVGVYNVQNRLQLYYGKEYGLVYESMPGMGTGVSVIIPAEGGEES